MSFAGVITVEGTGHSLSFTEHGQLKIETVLHGDGGFINRMHIGSHTAPSQELSWTDFHFLLPQDPCTMSRSDTTCTLFSQ